MNPTLEEKKKEYAALLIRIGLNVSKGQRLIIHAPYHSRACLRRRFRKTLYARSICRRIGRGTTDLVRR